MRHQHEKVTCEIEISPQEKDLPVTTTLLELTSSQDLKQPCAEEAWIPRTKASDHHPNSKLRDHPSSYQKDYSKDVTIHIESKRKKEGTFRLLFNSADKKLQEGFKDTFFSGYKVNEELMAQKFGEFNDLESKASDSKGELDWALVHEVIDQCDEFFQHDCIPGDPRKIMEMKEPFEQIIQSSPDRQSLTGCPKVEDMWLRTVKETIIKKSIKAHEEIKKSFLQDLV
ncbi:hypothetical protein DFH28DRAFT_930246 [Melampsora americana]|nr:hypothetical protein DFH28DRAFT_930246 [Melampsora americana]